MLYPELWIEEAIEQACAYNKRSWGYIEAILRRWRDEGKDDGKLGGYTKKISPWGVREATGTQFPPVLRLPRKRMPISAPCAGARAGSAGESPLAILDSGS